MNPIPDDIALRPRFQIEIAKSKEIVLSKLEKKEGDIFDSKRVDEHIFIKIKKEDIHFWSPQLHLEIEEQDNKSSKVYGVFGPNPSLWTFFMFLHFGIAFIFIVFGIWAYTKWSLGKTYTLQAVIMILMVITWFVLYFFGRIGKKKGRPQTEQLYHFMHKKLHTED